MKILITGIAGFIGSHIADEAIRQGHLVIGVDDLSNGRVENVPSAAKLFIISILSGDFARLVQGEMPQVIFHEAAQPSLRASIADPAWDATVNIIGTINAIQAARSVGAHLVFASTSAVYEPNAALPYFEAEKRNPNLPYGIAKYAAEMYIKNAGIPYTILRYGNVYGPRQIPIGENQLIPHCIRFLKGEEPDFAINGDGEQVRDFIFVRDIAKANLMIRNGTYNVATGIGTRVNDICEMLAEIAGKPEMKFPHRAGKEGETRHSVLAVTLAKQVGFQARTKLFEGLRETWESYK